MPQKRKRSSNYAFTKQQIRTLLDGINNPRDHLMINIGIHSGCRVGEIENLRLDKCDFIENQIVVWDNKHNKWSYLMQLNPKTGKRMRDKKVSEGRWRTIAMPARVMKELKAYIEKNPTQITKVRHDNYHMPDGGEEANARYVWALTRPTWERVIKKWSLILLGAPRSWHTLRHTYMTLHLESKSSLQFVMQQTGDTAATVLNTYAQVSPDERRKQAEKDLLEL